MARYCRKDASIEAVRFFDCESTIEAIKDMVGIGPGRAISIDYADAEHPVMKLGNLRVRIGQWLVKQIGGNYIVMTDHTFLSIYECVNG